MFDKIRKANKILNRVMMIIAGVAVLALMLLAAGNVILRIVHAPFHGAYELVGFLGAVVVAFALGHTQERGDHIQVDIFTRKFPAGLIRGIDRLRYLATAVFFAIVGWQVYKWGSVLHESGEVSETLKIPFYPFVYCVAVGFAVLTISLFVDFICAFESKPVPPPQLEDGEELG